MMFWKEKGHLVTIAKIYELDITRIITAGFV